MQNERYVNESYGVDPLRAELGKERADTIVRQALRDWSKQLFAAVWRVELYIPLQVCAAIVNAG